MIKHDGRPDEVEKAVWRDLAEYYQLRFYVGMLAKRIKHNRKMKVRIVSRLLVQWLNLKGSNLDNR